MLATYDNVHVFGYALVYRIHFDGEADVDKYFIPRKVQNEGEKDKSCSDSKQDKSNSLTNNGTGSTENVALEAYFHPLQFYHIFLPNLQYG